MSAGTDLIVRDVRAEEYAEVGRVLTEAYAAKVSNQAYLAEVADVGTRASEPGGRTLVAISRPDDQLLGSCVVTQPGSRLLDLVRPGESGLRFLATAPSARRRGAGRALLAEAIARARLAGSRALVLGTMSDMTNAQRLYESIGFRRIPERDEILPSGSRLLVYRLDLEPWPLVRTARPDELDAVGELTLDAYRCDGHLDKSGDYARELADARARAADAELLVAVDRDGGAPLGTVTICPEGSAFRELAAPNEVEFRMLGVAPAARGRGIGEALVRSVLDRAHQQGLRGAAIYSGSWMPTALRLYRRLGFERAPERDWEVEPGLRLLALTRQL